MTQIPGGTGASAQRPDLLAARARALARRGRGTVSVGTTRAYLVCACGPDRFGFPLGQVAQVLPMRPVTPLPGAKPAVLGLIALGGRVVGLLALARALGRPAESGHGPGEGMGHVVVMRGAATPVAFAVDRVLGTAEIADAALDGACAETGLSAEAVSGYAPAGAGPGVGSGFVVVDLPRLVRRYLP